jgi:preprotein translocase subunit SecD
MQVFMTRKLWQKLIFVVVIVLVCIYGVTGAPTSREELYANMEKSIPLGLDLKGGTHLILQVQIQDAARAEADQMIARLRQDLSRQSIPFTSLERNNPESVEDADSIEITVRGVPAERAGDFRSTIDEVFPEWIPAGLTSTDWKLTMRPSALSTLKSDTVTQSIATIENRVNGLGLAEPIIQQHGRADAEYEILVQLPGVSDPARVTGILQMTALLEIQEVLDGPYPSRQQALAAHSGILPANSEILMYPTRGADGQLQEQWYILNRTPAVTGRDLRNARASRDTETLGWQANFVLSPEAGQRFGQFTGANIGKSLAVVLDNRIKNVATIENRINDEGRIMGLSGEQEAKDLALVLRAGSLPASLEILEERTVGASLGADSIRAGIRAALLGLALIVIIMVVYYRRAGINANIALLLNLILLLAALSYFGFTLTLPGIAGIILTIGMAVDANVLIFERIREELKAGKGVVGALNAGFGKAFLTLIDTNLTTIIAATFLFLFGRGPIQGFAVTLVIGLLANLFTAVFVSRLIFDLSLARKQGVTELSI